MHAFKINVGLFCAVFFWASAFVGIRIGLTAYSPGSLALLRFLIASLFMGLMFLHKSNRQFIPFGHQIQLMIVGVAGIGVYNICLNYGEMTVPAGIASFVIGLMPMLTLLISVIFYDERPAKGVYGGMFVSLVGLLLMIGVTPDGGQINYGVMIIFIAAVVGAAYSFWQKPYLRLYHPVVVTAWIIWGGTLSLMIFSHTLWQEFPKADFQATFAVVYLGVFPAALAYMAWSYVLKSLSASYASIYLYAMPVISSLMGFFLLSERPTGWSLLGGLLSMVGAFYSARLINRSA